jgi:FecR protein
MKHLLAVTLVSLGLSAHAANSYKEATVTRMENDVRITLPGGSAPTTAATGQKLNAPATVTTGAKSRAELRFPDQSLTRLGANTIFTLRGEARTLDLQQGTMMLQVPKQLGGAKVRTASVTAAVTGTTIMVEYLPDGLIKVIVVEGSVDLFMNASPSTFSTINAGEMIIMNDTAKQIPAPVEVDLDRLLQTSKLLSKDEPNQPNNKQITNAINGQRGEIQKGELKPTGMVVHQGGTVRLEEGRNLAFNGIQVRNAAPGPQPSAPPPGGAPGPGGSGGSNNQPPSPGLENVQAPLIPGRAILNQGGQISGAALPDFPNGSVTYYAGNLRTAQPVVQPTSIGGAGIWRVGSFSRFFFDAPPGQTNQQLERALLQEGEWTVYKFEALSLSGQPELVAEPDNVLLATIQDIQIGGDPHSASIDLSKTQINNLVFYSQTGSIDMMPGTNIAGLGQNIGLATASPTGNIAVGGSVGLQNTGDFFANSAGNLTVGPSTAGQSAAGQTAVNVSAANITLEAKQDVRIGDSTVESTGGNTKVQASDTLTVTDSSVLRALADLSLRSTGPLAIESSTLDAATINLEAQTGRITLDTASISASDSFKARTFSPNGIVINGSTSIVAGSLIRMYSAAAGGSIVFDGNVTLDATRVDLAASTVQVTSGNTVTITKGNANIYADQHNYNTPNAGTINSTSINRSSFNARPSY